MTHQCTVSKRTRVGSRILLSLAVLAGSCATGSTAGAATVPGVVNDRECPLTAPFKIQIDNDVFCESLAEFCARASWRSECLPGATTTTLAPGEMRPRFSDDSVDVPGPVDGSRCPPSNPVATQVDNRLVCYTLLGFCETRNPTWYDEARGLWCPGATTTTTAPPTTTSTVAIRGTSGASGDVGLIDASQLTEVRGARGGSAFVVPPDLLSVQGAGSTARSVAVTVRATKRGARTLTFTIRTRGNQPIEIPSSLSRRGYRLAISVDGVPVLVIPPRT